MQITEIIFVSVLAMALSGGVGFLIGRNRKIGGVLSFVLGAVLMIVSMEEYCYLKKTYIV